MSNKTLSLQSGTILLFYCCYNKLLQIKCFKGFPGGASGKEPACQCRRCSKYVFDSWVRKIPWMSAWEPTLVFWPGEPMDRGAWQAMVHRVTKSQTWLKQLNIHTQPKIKLSARLFLSEGCKEELVFLPLPASRSFPRIPWFTANDVRPSLSHVVISLVLSLSPAPFYL